MKVAIRARFTDVILFEAEVDTSTPESGRIKQVVEAAVKSGANLYGANLDGANLYGANLDGANLDGANLEKCAQAPLVIARTRILPEGSIIGWKRARNDVMVQLHIPATAKRSHAFGRKCRAECAEVLALHSPNGEVKVAYSQHDGNFEYRVGDIVTPTEPFSENWQEECASGIHFFITREEAEAY